MAAALSRWRVIPVLVFSLLIWEAILVQSAVAVAGPAAERVQEKPVPAGGGASAPAAQAISAAALQVYRATCLLCHDVDGRGELGRDGAPGIPDFTDAKWQSSRSDAQLSQSILEGKGKAMPRMKNKLGSVDVKLMVAVVRAFRDGKQVVEEETDSAAPKEKSVGAPNSASSTGEPAPGLAPEKQLAQKEGGQLYQKTCARCHGRDGKGDIARDTFTTIPDFTVPPWQQKRSDSQMLVSILDGKGTGMPAFRDKISRERARDIVTYIRTFAPGATRAAASGPNDYQVRFNKLVKEFEDLAAQIRALSTPAPTAGAAPPKEKPVPKKS